MGKFQYLEHTADIAVEIEGENLDDLLRTAAEAWQNIVLEDSHPGQSQTRMLTLIANSPEELLVLFLNELNYFLLVKYWVPAQIRTLQILTGDGILHLEAEVGGETFSKNRHRMAVEIKALTFYQLKINRVGTRLKTRLVFDV